MTNKFTYLSTGCKIVFAYAAADGNVGTKQFVGIPGPSYVSAGIPGRGYRPNNAFPLKNPGNAIADFGPIKGAGAFVAHFAAPCGFRPESSGSRFGRTWYHGVAMVTHQQGLEELQAVLLGLVVSC